MLRDGSDAGRSLQVSCRLSPRGLCTAYASPTSPRSIPDTPVRSKRPSSGLSQHFALCIGFSVCCLCPQTSSSVRIKTTYVWTCSPRAWLRFEPIGSIPSLDVLNRDLNIYLHTKINSIYLKSYKSQIY